MYRWIGIFKGLAFVVVTFFVALVFLVPAVADAALARDLLNQALANPATRDCAILHLRPIQKHDASITVTAHGDLVGVSGQDERVESMVTYDIFNRPIASVTEWNGHTVRSVHEYAYTCPYDFIQSFHQESWEILKDGVVVGSRRKTYTNNGHFDETYEGDFVPVFTFYGQGPEPTKACDQTSLPPQQILDAPMTHTDTDAGIHNEISVDVYDRVVRIVQQLPLGFVAETFYEYFAGTYLDEQYSSPGLCSYRERKSDESGTLSRDGEMIAEYHLVFNEDGSIADRSSEGGRLVLFAIRILAPILGYSTDDAEGKSWFDERFGDS